MALLTDGNPNDTEGLRVFESAILDVAHVEGIDLDVSCVWLREEISQDVLDMLLGHTPVRFLIGGDQRRLLGVSDVVVSPQMKRWQALHTLAVVYRDAYNNQLNDRYLSKWDEYRELARGARERTYGFGIGLVAAPIPRAGTPVLGAGAGALAGALYYVQVSWVSAAGQEGSASCSTNFQTSDNSVLTVAAGNAPAGAVGWNVYVGLTVSTVTLQNSAPLAIGRHFTLPGSGVVGRAWSWGWAGCGDVRHGRSDFEAGVAVMAQAASIAAGKVVAMLTDSVAGLGPVLADIAADAGVELAAISVIAQNAPVALMEKSSAVKYPVVLVYSDRVQNLLTEKFRNFSGKVRTVAEVRASQDRIEGLEERVRLYVDAVTQVLDANRGDWGQGMFFTGGYEVKFDPVQHGGRNVLQVAKVIFEVDLSS